ncbi:MULTISPECIES: antibiotic biosynthesis monooxygenase family protein [unclassified Streptomyces]|uniref:antibiotic biosynthesis monooxygenase family protein n=1 Tax=Streptomycetaceae TaxID=2062 RepID=UPI002E7A1A6D|nr:MULTISPECIES: antibiotic biosynthesis monooxygenase family protein [unclassified Streptomyces]MED7951245.1 antibiotic biosynthesis monooxygenase [Streptomyces sp. BE303]MEE1826432.1 antibiotic biosynthesis monooxygenase [Streptomyces sp. BE20]
MPVDEGAARGRVLFLITVKEERREDFLKAYEQVRHLVAEGVPGHVRDQVCQSSTDPEQWLITSEWRALDDFVAWEETEEHRDLVRPMRECFTNAKSIRFHIQAETSRDTPRASLSTPTTTG